MSGTSGTSDTMKKMPQAIYDLAAARGTWPADNLEALIKFFAYDGSSQSRTVVVGALSALALKLVNDEKSHNAAKLAKKNQKMACQIADDLMPAFAPENPQGSHTTQSTMAALGRIIEIASATANGILGPGAVGPMDMDHIASSLAERIAASRPPRPEAPPPGAGDDALEAYSILLQTYLASRNSVSAEIYSQFVSTVLNTLTVEILAFAMNEGNPEPFTGVLEVVLDAVNAEFPLTGMGEEVGLQVDFETGTPMDIGTPRGPEGPGISLEFPPLIAAFGQQGTSPSERAMANRMAIPLSS